MNRPNFIGAVIAALVLGACGSDSRNPSISDRDTEAGAEPDSASPTTPDGQSPLDGGAPDLVGHTDAAPDKDHWADGEADDARTNAPVDAGAPDSIVGMDAMAGMDGGDAGMTYEPSLCTTGLQSPSKTRLSISTAEDDYFGSITDDELTLTWSTQTGATVHVFVAERDTVDDEFTVSDDLTGDFALDRAALMPNGLSLAVVNSDRKSFSVFARDDRGSGFSPSSASEFEDIVESLETAEKLGDPVYALGGSVFFYSRYGGDRESTVVFANRIGIESTFVVGADVTNVELQPSGSKRRRPTAVSSDYRTFFYFDEVSGTSKAGSFFGGFEFYAVANLGPVGGVQPSDDCGVLYFDAPGTGSRDLFVGGGAPEANE